MTNPDPNLWKQLFDAVDAEQALEPSEFSDRRILAAAAAASQQQAVAAARAAVPLPVVAPRRWTQSVRPWLAIAATVAAVSVVTINRTQFGSQPSVIAADAGLAPSPPLRLDFLAGSAQLSPAARAAMTALAAADDLCAPGTVLQVAGSTGPLAEARLTAVGAAATAAAGCPVATAAQPANGGAMDSVMIAVRAAD